MCKVDVQQSWDVDDVQNDSALALDSDFFTDS